MIPEPWLEVDLGPGVRAGFSTAAIGNLGLGVGDRVADVLARRRRAEQWLGGPVAWAHQVHGATVRVAERAGDDVAQCDGMVATQVGLAVLVADCVPVLLAGDGLVGTAHAGRQGVAAGVVGATVAAMRAAGATRLRAVIGPAICGRCYEVPATLRDEVDAIVPGSAATTSWGTPALDLPRAVLGQLEAAGVVAEPLDLCTRTDHRFFSHRGAGEGNGPAGRIAGLVRLG